MEDDHWHPHPPRGSELLVELVCDIDLRNHMDENGVLYVLLSSAWPARLEQNH